MSVALAAPVLAAKPTLEVIDMGTPEALAADSAYLTALCGFAVTATASATVTVHVFADRAGAFKREIDKYQIVETFTNDASGASTTIHDVGPDLVWVNRDGATLIAQIGRSLSGSGYIGRVVIDGETYAVLSIAGRSVGSLDELICGAIAG